MAMKKAKLTQAEVVALRLKIESQIASAKRALNKAKVKLMQLQAMCYPHPNKIGEQLGDWPQKLYHCDSCGWQEHPF